MAHLKTLRSRKGAKMMLHHPAAMVSISLAGRLLGGEVRENENKRSGRWEELGVFLGIYIYVCVYKNMHIIYNIYIYINMCIHNRNEIECNNSGNHWKGVTNDLCKEPFNMHPGSRWKRCQENNSTAKTCNSHKIESTVLFELDSGDGSHYQAAFFFSLLLLSLGYYTLWKQWYQNGKTETSPVSKRGQKITPEHRCQIACFTSKNIYSAPKLQLNVHAHCQ